MPVVRIVAIELGHAFLHDIAQPAAPAVPPVVFMQAVDDSLISRALHGHVERRIDAQPLLMHRGGAIRALEILADFLDEIWSKTVPRRGQMQCQRRRRCGFRLLRADLALFRHIRKHQIAPRARSLRMQHRRIFRSGNDARQKRRLGQRQLAHWLAEIIFRRRFESIIPMPEINLIAVHGQNLLLRVMPFDLNRQQHFLNLAPK